MIEYMEVYLLEGHVYPRAALDVTPSRLYCSVQFIALIVLAQYINSHIVYILYAQN